MSWRARFSFASQVAGIHTAVLVLLALVAADAVLLAELKPSSLSADLPALLLIVQIFGASRGYKRVAASGCLDPLLLSIPGRWKTGLLLFSAVLAPGLLAWLVVGASQWAALGWEGASSLHPAGLTAFFFVSAIAWAANLTLPRYTSGLLWVLVMVTLPMLVTRPFALLVEILTKFPDRVGHHLVAALALGAAEPVSISSIPWPHHAELALLAFSVGALAAGLTYIHRRDVPLAS